MDSKEIGKKIYITRKEKEKTLQEIANDTGLTRSTIQRYEKGIIEKIKLPVIQAIAESLSVNPVWLIGKSDDREANVWHGIKLTANEQAHIQKYRALDDRGRTNVDHLLETEYQHAIKPNTYKPRVVAAHVDGELTKNDVDIIEYGKRVAAEKREREARADGDD